MSPIKWRRSFEECLLSRERWVYPFIASGNGMGNHGDRMCY